MGTRIDPTKSTYYSYMNPSLEITENDWSVSIAVENKPFSMHTVLLFETIQEDKRLNFKAHLMGPGTLRDKKPYDGTAVASHVGSPFCCWQTTPEVEIKSIKDVINRSRYRSSYLTWGVAREKVNQLMEKIKTEHEHPEQVIRPFHILGEHSFFSTEKDVLSINDQKLLEIKEKEPEKFKRMYDNYQFLKGLSSVPQFHIRGGDHPIRVFGLSVSKIFTPPHVVHELSKKSNADTIALFDRHVKITKVASQNCFNWARHKLATIDIRLEEHSFECIATIPTLCLSRKRKSGEADGD